jgi:NADH-quinone oxidoreductase subunit J
MAETWQQVIFWIIAVVMTVGALRVVTTRNVIHAALYLVATLIGVAGLYVLLLAEFIAWAQVLVYVGAVVVLMLFGLMLTRAPIGSRDYDNNQRLLAAGVAGGIFLVMSWIMVQAFDGQKVDIAGGTVTRTEDVGRSIFHHFVLPFEAISVLLLAALIGAVMIARRDTPEDEEAFTAPEEEVSA